MTLEMKPEKSGVTFAVKVVPGSSRTAIAGLLGPALKVNVAAPPEKGKANKELVNLLARVLGRPKNTIAVVSGTTNPHKEVYARDLTPAQLLDALGPYLK